MDVCMLIELQKQVLRGCRWDCKITFCGVACVLDKDRKTWVILKQEAVCFFDHYDTSAIRGDDMLRLWSAGRPNVTKSCGRNCSGGLSMRSLFRMGSNVDDTFSLSSEECEAKNGSLLNAGVTGVRGISSEISDADVVELVGVLKVEANERLGVTGNGAEAHRRKRLP